MPATMLTSMIFVCMTVSFCVYLCVCHNLCVCVTMCVYVLLHCIGSNVCKGRLLL